MSVRISVIVPFRDSEAWIGRCCESLHRQQGRFQFVLVNDGSTDSGKEIAERYKDKDDRFIVLDNARGPGVSGARNTGLDHATGEWVTFLDADDEMLDGAYETFTEVIKSDPADIHQLNHLRYYPQLNRLVMKYTNTGGRYDLTNMPDLWVGVWNKLIRAEFVKDIRFDENLQYGEDGLFSLECIIKAGYIHHAEYGKKAVKHRFDNANSLSRKKTRADIEKQAKVYLEFCDRQQDPIVKAVCYGELQKIYRRAAKLKKCR